MGERLNAGAGDSVDFGARRADPPAHLTSSVPYSPSAVSERMVEAMV